MTQEVELRCAAVGLGWVATNRHIPALRRAAGARLVGVVDHRPGRAAEVAAGLRLPLWSEAADPSQVAWLDQVEAVTIGTPPMTHHRLAVAYMEAGKHVLLEKPMAMTLGEAEDLQATSRRTGRMLAVVHNFQFSRSARAARRLLESGRLGELRGIWAAQLSNPRRRLPAWYEDLPLGLFYDESPHFFYLVRSLLSEEPRIEAAHVVPSREGRTTPAKISMQLAGGSVPVQIDMNFEAPLSEWHLALLGTRRAAVIDVFRDVLVAVPNDGAHTARDILRSSFRGVSGHAVGFVTSGLQMVGRRLTYGNDEVMRRFLDACRTGREPEGLSAADGLHVVRMQHEVLRMAAPA